MAGSEVIDIGSEAELDRLIDRAKAEHLGGLTLLGPYARTDFLQDKASDGAIHHRRRGCARWRR